MNTESVMVMGITVVTLIITVILKKNKKECEIPCYYGCEYEDAELERGAVQFCRWALTSPRNLVLPSAQSKRVSSLIIFS